MYSLLLKKKYKMIKRVNKKTKKKGVIIINNFIKKRI